MSATPTYKKKDFMSDQMVRWCPGCGDYAILSQVQTVMAKSGIPKENFAVISGIGCSSRFPYYMNTYGMHSIHGRAPAFATGLKLARPELSVWVITGDGDCLSIGGNHIIHALRRNIDLNIILFDNRIYGLTKGQYSPTSEVGKRTKSSPYGSLDNPFNPLRLALGAGACHVSQTVDVFAAHLREMLTSAQQHKGASFVHVLQNCVIFNDGAFTPYTDRSVRDQRVLYLKHGEPLIWGKDTRYGLVLDGLSLDMIELVDEADEAKVLHHDAGNLHLAHLLAELDPEQGYPLVVGDLYKVERPAYDQAFQAQVAAVTERFGQGELEALVHGRETWNL